MSLFAQTMKHSINHFREERVQRRFEDGPYQKIKAICDELYPHLEVLDGAMVRPPPLRCAPTYKPDNDVTESATCVYNWLKKPTDPFRAYLAIMSGGGDRLRRAGPGETHEGLYTRVLPHTYQIHRLRQSSPMHSCRRCPGSVYSGRRRSILRAT